MSNKKNSKKKDKIAQMIDFIMTEASEKAEEIRIQTEEEFSILKQTKVEEAKKMIRAEFERKEKTVKVEKKIFNSNLIKQQRLKVLKLRDDILKRFYTKAIKDLNENVDSKLLSDLILEGALQLREEKISVSCRAEDVEKIKPDDIKEQYKKITKTELKEVKINGDLKEKHGVIIFGFGDRLKVENTLEMRLQYAVTQLQPIIKEICFENLEDEKKK